MKIILAIKSGLSKTFSAWKGILIFWFITVIMVTFLVNPLKASLAAALGKSMITEKLVNGINIDVLSDLGTNLHSLFASFFSGLIFLLIAAVLINMFITGGIFSSLRHNHENQSGENFFSSSAKNFWSYLVILTITYIIAIVLFVLIVIIPVSVAGKSDTAPEGIVFRILTYSGVLFLLAISIIFLVADYARAWQAARSSNACFKALGYGFSQTFRTFLSSYPLMLIMVILQAIPFWIAYRVISGFAPTGSGGVFLLFFCSQLLFIFKIFLRVMRYGSVTSLMEQYPVKSEPVAEHITLPEPDLFTPAGEFVAPPQPDLVPETEVQFNPETNV